MTSNQLTFISSLGTSTQSLVLTRKKSCVMINNDGPRSLRTCATIAFRNFLAYLTLNKVSPLTSLPYLCSDIHVDKPVRQVTYPPYTHLLSMFCQCHYSSTLPSLCPKNFNFLILSKWVFFVNFFIAHVIRRASFFRIRSVALRSLLLSQD